MVAGCLVAVGLPADRCVAGGAGLAGRWPSAQLAAAGWGLGGRGGSGRCGGYSVAVELEQVVGGGDQAPLAADGVSAAALEAVGAAVVFGVTENGFDHRFASAVETAAELGLEDAAHERVVAAVPAGPGAFALVAVGADQDLDALADQALHLDLVPVAGVGEHALWLFADPRCLQFSAGGAETWFDVSEVGAFGADLGGDHDPVLVDDGLRVVALHE